jgi:hypothetical protein
MGEFCPPEPEDPWRIFKRSDGLENKKSTFQIQSVHSITLNIPEVQRKAGRRASGSEIRSL